MHAKTNHATRQATCLNAHLCRTRCPVQPHGTRQVNESLDGLKYVVGKQPVEVLG